MSVVDEHTSALQAWILTTGPDEPAARQRLAEARAALLAAATIRPAVQDPWNQHGRRKVTR